MIARIIAIAFIFAGTSVAWLFLGGTISARTGASDGELRTRVASVWGSPQTQKPPSILDYAEPARSALLPLESSKINVAIDLDHRQKGLLWYSTYGVNFDAKYGLRNPADEARTVTIRFPFPAAQAIYDNLAFTLDGKPISVVSQSNEAIATAVLPAGASAILGVSYHSQGLDTWTYNFGDAVSQVKNFSLILSTNFKAADFPENSIAPTAKRETAHGWDFEWNYKSLVSGVHIAVTCPEKLQPGPLAGQISFFAPVSLLFFFFVLFIVTTMRGIDLHPVNYFFLAAAFFAFHLLLAYLVDHISIHIAFLICSLVSIFLVVSYLRLVVGIRFAAVEAAGAQFVYLVLFSYAFFFKGYTGLAVTIGAIVTLFLVMQMTGRIKWQDRFNLRSPLPGPPAVSQP